jgi:hypothetical protein
MGSHEVSHNTKYSVVKLKTRKTVLLHAIL